MSEGHDAVIRDRLSATSDLLEMVRGVARTRANHPAVVFLADPDDPDPRVYTYATLQRQAEAVAEGLKSVELGRDQAVAILSPTTPEALAVLIGASSVGVAFPLNPLLSPQAMAAQMRLACTRAVFVAQEHPDLDHHGRLKTALASTPDIDLVVRLPLTETQDVGLWGTDRGAWSRWPAPSPRADNGKGAAALFHTGGTTGHPKLAELSARGMVAGAIMSAAALSITSDDRLLIGLPLFHVGGAITSILSTLSAGGTVILCGLLGARSPKLVAGVWRALAQTRATALVLVPTSLGSVVETPINAADLSHLRGVVTGSSALSPVLAARLEAKIGKPVCQVYGMTELSGICTAQPLDGQFRTPAVGRPAPLLELAFDHDGAVGEVLLGGPNRFLGYRTVQGETAPPSDDPIRSGDLGRLDADGQLHLLGRRKDVIIRGGHNIDPMMIEDAAYSFGGVAQAAAVAMPDTYAGEVPILYVSVKNPSQFVLEDLEDHLRNQIAEPPARPKRIMVLDTLPLTPVGKVARFALRQAAAEIAAWEALDNLSVSNVLCRDTAAKEITVEWQVDADRSAVEIAAEILSHLGLRLAP
ncbi:AMP-binding protein [Phenylobacterium sp. Root700]|uniref:AMP-binding protein n=1 Tax=Phenylobacterium sp. Root700 TaxID=1736591 RepID=UPI0006FA78D5|nr:AMP-binding protein [Phenylobacterium sp. Root700]KRB52673.1 hypothetical protein ASE02_11870 [Phenylobacterium sp. Root700]